ncbi:MAG: hypothetical protein IIV85_00335 [Clostridia bacterium]|nr:hypothetical protein [Clostridia bacterium]
MENFWDYSVWGSFLVIGVLLSSLLVANIIKRRVRLLQESLIPTSVLGGGVLLVMVWVYKALTGELLFLSPVFGENGYSTLEILTYHCLALGFIASSLKTSEGKMTGKRASEIFNTGVTTVSTYLLQGIVGMGITILAARFMGGFFEAAGLLLPFGYGQGTGQALNYGNIYETQFGFSGGKAFGLTIAALGFLSAALGGVVHLNLMKKKGKLKTAAAKEHRVLAEEIERDGEIPMQESIDKLTFQLALIAVAYLFAYLLMYGLGLLLPGMRSVIYGFNFLLGVLAATLLKGIMSFFKKIKLGVREYTNNFLLTRTSNMFFDIMVTAGIAAIRLDMLEDYWGILVIVGIAGLIVTYAYNRFVAVKLFPEYAEEQFLMMYGMLTGTASTGIILLREVDGDFRTPAADNMVYQNFPAIVFGFPIMLLATLAPVKPMLTLLLLAAFMAVLNIILFRSFIFKKRK